jgi:WD40 repeat protein
MSAAPFYVVGGTVHPDAPSYVVREADEELYRSLRQGELCYVLTTRQMGKSSLMVRTAARLAREGTTAAILDLSALGQNLTPEQWYQGLVLELAQQLGLDEELLAEWSRHAASSPLQRWRRSLLTLLRLRSGPVVLFIDEIEAVRTLPFSADEFFAAIREVHSRRAAERPLDRLTFCLLGVATPSQLVRDPHLTPFNIGRRIELADFTPEEAGPLAAGFDTPGSQPSRPTFQSPAPDCPRRGWTQRLLHRVLYWTGGHPYLTQRLCQKVAEAMARGNGAVRPDSTWIERRRCDRVVDEICAELFLADDGTRRDDNLQFIHDRLLRGGPDPAGLLTLYRRVLSGARVPEEPRDSLSEALRLCGLVEPAGGLLHVRNRIYGRVFDERWVRAHMPDAELQRQRTAFRQGVARTAGVAAVCLAIVGGLAAWALSGQAAARKAESLAEERYFELEKRTKELRRAQEHSAASEKEALRAQGEAEGEQRRAEAASGRALAGEQAARREKTAAEASRAQAHERLVSRTLETGRRAVEAGDLFGALLWYADALHADAGDPTHELPHRLRIASIFRQLPILVSSHRLAGEIRFLEFDRGGRRLAAVTAAGHAAVWPLGGEVGPPVRTRGLQRVDDVRFSGKSCRLLAVAPPLRTGSLPKAMEVVPHPGGGAGIGGLSADGALAITIERENAARVRRVSTGVAVGPILQHDRPLRLALLSPDGRLVFTTPEDGPGRIWRLDGADPVEVPIWNQFAMRLAAFSPDSRLLAAGKGSDASVWDARSGRRLSRLRHPAQVRSLAFSSDSHWVLTTAHDGAARVWDVRTGILVSPMLRHPEGVRLAALSPSGARVVTIGGDHTARVWDTLSGTLALPPLPHGARVTSARFSPDGARLATGAADGSVRYWDLATGDGPDRVLRPGPVPIFATLSDDSRWYFTCDGAGLARLFNTSTGRCTAVLRFGRPVLTAAFSRDGKRLVVDAPGSLRSFTTSGVPTGPRVAGQGSTLCLALSSDGRRAAAGSSFGGTLVWDLRTGARVVLPGDRDIPVRSVSFSHSGRLLAAGSDNGTVRIWDAVSGALLHRMRHRDVVSVVRFGPHDRRLLSASFDHTARLWDPVAGRGIGGALLHDDRVVDACFSPDGARVLTVSLDRAARLWKSENGRAAASPMLHSGAVTTGRFDPTGAFLVTSAEGVSRVWDSRDGEPITPPLRSDHGAVQSAFGPGDRTLLRRRSSGELEFWTLPAAPGSPAALGGLVRRLSAHEIDRSSALRPLPPLEWTPERDPGYAPALRPTPGRLAVWHALQADAASAAGEWREARLHLDYLLPRRPRDPRLARLSAEVSARLEDWPRAAREYAGVADLTRDAGVRYQVAVACLAGRDRAGFERALARMLDRARASGERHAAELAGWLAALPVEPSPQLPAALALVAHHLGKEPSNPELLGTYGALLLRAGRPKEAVPPLRRCTEAPQREPRPQDYCFLSLAYRRTGDTAEARRCLTRARAEADELRRLALSDVPGLSFSWDDRIEVVLLLAEASRR